MTNPSRNPAEYYASPVTRAEQISFKSSEGCKFQAFLDEVNPNTLEGVEFVPGKPTRYPIPRESGIYFVFVNNTLVYIGQACSIAARVRGHHNVLTPLKKSTSLTVRWLLLPRNKRLKAETYLTRKFLAKQEAKANELATN